MECYNTNKEKHVHEKRKRSGNIDEKQGEFCIDMLMIAKYFERIGDHATNIAEWVEYSITGTHLE